MTFKNRTKIMFADELREELKHIPFDKVRVNDLCKTCGTDRRTFYYHFADKYDLVAWIWMKDYLEALSEENGEYTLEQHVKTLERIYNDRHLYRSVFTSNSRNGVIKHMFTYFYNLGVMVSKKYYRIDSLSVKMDYSIRAHVYACINTMVDWLQGSLPYTAEELAKLHYTYMPSDLKKAYNIPDIDFYGN